jgi:hypothetical protein
MKATGVILSILGVLNIIMSLGALSANSGDPGQLGPKIVIGVGLLGLGIYLIQRANSKKKEDEDRNKWNRGE